jgi:hypothetical protein
MRFKIILRIEQYPRPCLLPKGRVALASRSSGIIRYFNTSVPGSFLEDNIMVNQVRRIRSDFQSLVLCAYCIKDTETQPSDRS